MARKVMMFIPLFFLTFLIIMARSARSISYSRLCDSSAAIQRLVRSNMRLWSDICCVQLVMISFMVHHPLLVCPGGSLPIRHDFFFGKNH